MTLNRFKKFMFLLIMTISLLSCDKDEYRYIVGFSLPTQREERWVRDKESMINHAKELNVKLNVEVCDNNASLQINQCKKLIKDGAQILILAPHDNKTAITIVENAKMSGVPVIAYDRMIENADLDLFVSFDNKEIGRLQAEYLVENAPSGNYVVLSGSPNDSNSAILLEGAMDVLSPYIERGEINILSQKSIMDWNPTEAFNIMEGLLEDHSKISAILAPNDGTANGVINALKKRGLEGSIPVTGQDGEVVAARNIIDGFQGMTVYSDTTELSRIALKMSIYILQGKGLTGLTDVIYNQKHYIPSVLLEPESVTMQNLDKVLFDSGYIKFSDEYKK